MDGGFVTLNCNKEEFKTNETEQKWSSVFTGCTGGEGATGWMHFKYLKSLSGLTKGILSSNKLLPQDSVLLWIFN